MKDTKNNFFVEYLSLLLILSYLFVHNIILVLIGITISLYLINIKFINRIITSINNINKNLVIQKLSREFNKIYNKNRISSIDLKSQKEDSKLKLVEAVEELGFIPSNSKDENSNAA